MSKFNQTSQFAKAVSSILGIVDQYLTSKMKETVDVVVRKQSNKLKEEAEAENQEFLNQIEKYIIKSLGAEVLVISTNQPQTSYAVAPSLSEFELKKILIDKMETNKSINISDIQKNLYNALVEAYNSDKDIFSSYGDVVTLKRGRDDQDKDEDPSDGSDRGTKGRKSSKNAEPSKDSQSQRNQSHLALPKALNLNLNLRVNLHKQRNQNLKLQTQRHNKIKGMSLINTIAKATQPPYTFDELMDTPIDFSAYVMNQCYKAVNDRLDWHNPEGREYLFDLSKPLPLIEDRGHQVVPTDYFINNDLEYSKV
ncbi:hypothetical protein Tco_1039051 [Tanacetum coccineum]